MLVVAVMLASAATLVYAANPIVTNRFIADPSAHVFNGRVYLYVTHDSGNDNTFWNSRDWRAYSSTDLVNWTDHGAIFAVGSGFSWASNYAWAPAAIARNGFYYLYLPADAANANSISKIGVARSSSPTSGFVDARGNPLIQEGRDANAGSEVIDPMVFIDDDGQAYLYYGGLRVLKAVRLNADMISLNGAIQTLSVSNYAEAPWVHKRNGIYYLTYSTGWPGQIAYATGNSPLGPFTYRGIALDFVNVNTNHQAVVQYNNQWFLFYHRGTLSGWSNYRRSVQIDCLFYNADGTLRQVAQTTQGVTSSSCGGSGPTPTPTPTGSTFRIVNRNSGKCLDVNGVSSADGANVQQWTCNGGNNQRWRVEDQGNGYSRIVAVHSGKVLDVANCGTGDGADIRQWAWLNNNCQQWRLITTTSPWVRIENRNSGRVADVANCGTGDGADVRQWAWLNNNCQQWQLQP